MWSHNLTFYLNKGYCGDVTHSSYRTHVNIRFVVTRQNQGTTNETLKDAHRVFLLLVLFGARLPVADKVVQRTVLYKRGEDEDEADGHEQVHGGHVGNLGQGFPGDGTERSHGEHSGDAWWTETQSLSHYTALSVSYNSNLTNRSLHYEPGVSEDLTCSSVGSRCSSDIYSDT